MDAGGKCQRPTKSPHTPNPLKTPVENQDFTRSAVLTVLTPKCLGVRALVRVVKTRGSLRFARRVRDGFKKFVMCE